METDRRRQLEQRFRGQAAFATDYSPLYAQIYAIVADWLAADTADPVVDWLLAVSAERQPIDVTLLLAAALHRDVLAGEPAAAALARYYPTAGDRGSMGEGEQGSMGAGEVAVTPAPLHPFSPTPFLPYSPSPPLAISLREAILARQEPLADFIRHENVQTNETGRGLAWLLPVACLGWPAVHLVELGASAGLNLVADRRVYRLAAADEPDRTLLQLGDGPPQFTTLATTTLVRGAAEIPPLACCPTILSRTGGDMFPFHLRAAEDELKLASFIWADQPHRIARLREGIAALREVESTAAPVRLHPLHLPDGLPAFLANAVPRPLEAPVVIFNTVVTMYLPDRGASMRGIIAEWAAAQSVPVLWLQWEGAWDGPEQPAREWQAWTADYWPNDGRGDGGAAAHHWHLAWVHPHGTALEWLEDWPKLLSITMQN